ncbi:MAG: fumarate hydratase, partial [Actinobacteria bacterium]|nr:fumarate hydratase [Actinomycetota bacterium]
MAEFQYTELLPLGEDKTAYRKISDSGFKIEKLGNKEFLVIEPETIKKLTFEAMHDSQHYLRTSHLKQLRKILDDKEASNNDKFVALDLLKNANISSGGVLPMCQDTGTVIITGKRGSNVITNSHDEEVIAEGVFNAYQQLNLRYSQLAPLSMWEEKNTGTNLPAQIE